MTEKPNRIPATLVREVLERIGDKAVRHIRMVDVVIECEGELFTTKQGETCGDWIVTPKDNR